MIYNPVNEVNQSNFFLLIFWKSTAVLLIWKYRYLYRGTNFSKVPSTGTAVLLQSTVPTYAYRHFFHNQTQIQLFNLVLFILFCKIEWTLANARF